MEFRILSVDVAIKQLTEQALKKSHGNRTLAAQYLGVSVRTVRNWVRKYGLAKSFPPPRRVKKK